MSFFGQIGVVISDTYYGVSGQTSACRYIRISADSAQAVFQQCTRMLYPMLAKAIVSAYRSFHRAPSVYSIRVCSGIGDTDPIYAGLPECAARLSSSKSISAPEVLAISSSEFETSIYRAERRK